MQTWYLYVKQIDHKGNDKQWRGLITPDCEIEPNSNKKIVLPYSSISFKIEDLDLDQKINIDFVTIDEKKCHQFEYCKNIKKENNQLSFSYANYKYIESDN